MNNKFHINETWAKVAAVLLVLGAIGVPAAFVKAATNVRAAASHPQTQSSMQARTRPNDGHPRPTCLCTPLPKVQPRPRPTCVCATRAPRSVVQVQRRPVVNVNVRQKQVVNINNQVVRNRVVREERRERVRVIVVHGQRFRVVEVVQGFPVAVPFFQSAFPFNNESQFANQNQAQNQTQSQTQSQGQSQSAPQAAQAANVTQAAAQPQTTSVTATPTTMPATGPETALGGAAGLTALAYAGRAYVRSRRALMSSLRNK